MPHNNLDDLMKRMKVLAEHKFQDPISEYARQEIIRFCELAGLLVNSFPKDPPEIKEGHVIHIVLRSLMEGWAWVSYIYSNKNEKQTRFNELMNGFKIEYHKVINDQYLPLKGDLKPIPSGENWGKVSPANQTGLIPPRDICSILASMKSSNGEGWDVLYFAYRIMSFDTHAKASNALFCEAFHTQEDIDFGYIKHAIHTNFMARDYLRVLDIIEGVGVITEIKNT